MLAFNLNVPFNGPNVALLKLPCEHIQIYFLMALAGLAQGVKNSFFVYDMAGICGEPLSSRTGVGLVPGSLL